MLPRATRGRGQGIASMAAKFIMTEIQKEHQQHCLANAARRVTEEGLTRHVLSACHEACASVPFCWNSDFKRTHFAGVHAIGDSADVDKGTKIKIKKYNGFTLLVSKSMKEKAGHVNVRRDDYASYSLCPCSPCTSLGDPAR